MIFFYVPLADAQMVKEAMFAAGAGELGNYKRCSWQCEGVGQFEPKEGADPHIGSVGNIEHVKELKVEIVCSNDSLKAAVEALKRTHPYEEPAFGIVKLSNHKI